MSSNGAAIVRTIKKKTHLKIGELLPNDSSDRIEIVLTVRYAFVYLFGRFCGIIATFSCT